MIEPKTITVQNIDGKEKEFVISKVPATVGREIVATYPVSAMPKIGDYKVNEEIMLKMMNYVCVENKEGHKTFLQTKALIDSHCDDWQVLAKLEIAMLEYNTSFFGNGKVSKLLNKFTSNLPQLISKTLMDLLEQLSEKEKQVSKN